MKKEKELAKLEKKLSNLYFWRLMWSFPIKGCIILSILATAIAFPFSLTAGFACLGALVTSLTIDGINYAVYDKVYNTFTEKINKVNSKIKEAETSLTKEVITYEEYKKQNSNTSTLVVNYPNGEKQVSTIFRDKGPIVVEEEDTLNK